MITLTVVALIVMALCMGVLAIPVTMAFSVTFDEKARGRLTISWFRAWLRYDSGAPAPRPKKGRTAAPQPGDTEQRATSSRKPAISRWLRMARLIPDKKAMGRRALKLLVALARRARLQRLTIAGRMGLDNPADTGRLWGAYCALSGVLSQSERIALRMEPDFAQAVFTLDGRGVIRITPLRVLTDVMGFCLSRPVLRAIWTVVRQKG